MRTDASGNILRFFKDRGFYQFNLGAVDTQGSGNPLNIYTNPGTTQNWTVALNGLTKYPSTSQLVKIAAVGIRTNYDYIEQSIQEQISGVYYIRANMTSMTIAGNGGSYQSGVFYECDLVNGVWQVVGHCDVASGISASIYVDGIREPANWFQV